MTTVLVSAGDASGDRHAAAFVRGHESAFFLFDRVVEIRAEVADRKAGIVFHLGGQRELTER